MPPAALESLWDLVCQLSGLVDLHGMSPEDVPGHGSKRRAG